MREASSSADCPTVGTPHHRTFYKGSGPFVDEPRSRHDMLNCYNRRVNMHVPEEVMVVRPRLDDPQRKYGQQMVQDQWKRGIIQGSTGYWSRNAAQNKRTDEVHRAESVLTRNQSPRHPKSFGSVKYGKAPPSNEKRFNIQDTSYHPMKRQRISEQEVMASVRRQNAYYTLPPGDSDKSDYKVPNIPPNFTSSAGRDNVQSAIDGHAANIYTPKFANVALKPRQNSQSKRRVQQNSTAISKKRRYVAQDQDAPALLLSLAMSREPVKERVDTASACSSLREDISTSSTETKNSPEEDPQGAERYRKPAHESVNAVDGTIRSSSHFSGFARRQVQMRRPPPVTRIRNYSQTGKKISNSIRSSTSAYRTHFLNTSVSNSGLSTGMKGKPYRCEAPGCDCSFSTRFSLKRHMKKHTGERPHICPYNCGKRFAEKSTLTRHVRIHTGERPYVCKFPNCGKSFADRTNVKRHELIHLGQRPYHCKYCARGFFRPKQVVKHVAKMHPNQE
mmetsp:Transcript_21902/g.53599  ORF Transcript_21902/g.53599 Transcript_21902/m.53599 type:complete len:504 (+) Transcript_21902:310-1821(+)